MRFCDGLETVAPYRELPPSKEITAIRPSATPENPTNAECSAGDFDPKVYHENITLRFR
jgi:hypothetical protein